LLCSNILLPYGREFLGFFFAGGEGLVTEVGETQGIMMDNLNICTRGMARAVTRVIG
jgi:hypothetical protein